MEQRSHTISKSSGIPRLSRLPILREPLDANPRKDPVKYNLKSRALPRVRNPEPQDPITSVQPETIPTANFDGGRTISESLRSSHAESVSSATLDTPIKAKTLPRRPRPSLSDRTIETLSQIPPSPSPQRRTSAFFPPESPAKTPSRPGSSLSRSRPGTSHGAYPPMPTGFPVPRPVSPTKRQLVPITGNRMANASPTRRSISSYNPKITDNKHGIVGDTLISTPSKTKPPPGSNSNDAADSILKVPKNVKGSKTLAARPSRPRASIQDAFAKPWSKVTDPTAGNPGKETKPVANENQVNSMKSRVAVQPPAKKSYQMAKSSLDPQPQKSGESPASKSSAALRETIAKAKAAKRRASANQNKGSETLPRQEKTSLDIDINGPNDDLLRKRVAGARIDGRLNIAALGLTEMPAEVMNMYNNANLGDRAWYESVDLVRLIVADNEFETINDDAFPDEPVVSRDEAEDYQGNLFAGLETLDFHGNHLNTIPNGLRRLERLTTLNVSKNRLTNDSLQILGQITSLRELRLAENCLDDLGFGFDLGALESLEILDVARNNIDRLPDDINKLSRLRVLDVAGNKLASLPWESLNSLPLVELAAARNRLSGNLIPTGITMLEKLKSLSVANNALIAISDSKVDLPSLQSLDATGNRLNSLPDISGWAELLTLTIGGNKLSSWPKGMTSLKRLKTVDATQNDIRTIDEGIGFMDDLTVLRISNNPLRERRFLTMDTGELKRELRARLVPDEAAAGIGLKARGIEDVVGSNVRPISDSALDKDAAGPKAWPVKAGGILDRSAISLDKIEPSDLELAMQNAEIKTFLIHHNLFTSIPLTIDLIASSLLHLDLSNNKLANAAYVSQPISLPVLDTLNISMNSINSLSPLLEYFEAPKLSELNVSRNRLTALPLLRDSFQSLRRLFISDNRLKALQYGMVRGLQVLDVRGNEISHLDPKLGLLGAEGLRTLIITGNTFRVPRREVVEKGTEAVLTWLRGRIPESNA